MLAGNRMCSGIKMPHLSHLNYFTCFFLVKGLKREDRRLDGSQTFPTFEGGELGLRAIWKDTAQSTPSTLKKILSPCVTMTTKQMSSMTGKWPTQTLSRLWQASSLPLTSSTWKDGDQHPWLSFFDPFFLINILNNSNGTRRFQVYQKEPKF